MKLKKISNAVIFKDQDYHALKAEYARRHQPFTDPCFQNASQIIGNDRNRIPVMWRRLSEITPGPVLFNDFNNAVTVRSSETTPKNVAGGFAFLVTNKDFIHLVIPDLDKQQSDMANTDIGIFHFRFWQCDTWVDVVVDDTLPSFGGVLMGVQGGEPNEFWAALVEKAYAKLYGSYQILRRLKLIDVLQDFTGGVCTVMNIIANPDCDIQSNNMYNFMLEELKQFNSLCLTNMVEESVYRHPNLVPRDEPRTRLGIRRDRLYVPLEVQKIEDISVPGIESHCLRLVKIRDPIRKGQSPFTISSIHREVYGDEDSYAFTAKVLSALNTRNSMWLRMRDEEKERLGLLSPGDNEFWMPLDDIITDFTHMLVLRFYNMYKNSPQVWYEYVINGAWTVGIKGSCFDRCGGIFNYNVFRNPQYLVLVKRASNISVQLIQRAEDPFEAEDIGMTIVKVEANRITRAHTMLSHFRSVFERDVRSSRTVSFQGFFSPGRYIIIPAAFRPPHGTEYILKIHSSHKLTYMELKKEYISRCLLFSRVPKMVTAILVIELQPRDYPLNGKKFYCEITCDGIKEKTGLIDGNEPICNEGFVFFRKRKPSNVVIKVYEKRMVRDKFLGHVTIDARAPTAGSVDFEEAIVPHRRRADGENGVCDFKVLVRVTSDSDVMAM